MRRRATAIGLEVWLPALVVALWWLISTDSTSLFFPPLRTIIERFREIFLSAQADTHLVPSLGHLAAGYAIAAVVGVAGGVLLGLSQWAHAAVNPLVHFLRALPPPALLPFAIVALGIGAGMKIAIIGFGILFPILLNTIDGVRGVDPLIGETCRAYRVPASLRIRSAIVPAAMPQILAGLRAGLQSGLLLMVVSEMVAANGGIGYLIIQSQQQFATTDMWAGILLLGIVGYVLNMLFVLGERRVLRWYIVPRESDAGA